MAFLTVTGPAKADAVFFGYRSVPGYHHHHHGYRGAHYYPAYRRYPRYAQTIVAPPPPAVVYRAPPVYAAPPVTLVPASPIYQTTDGRYCREYQTVITVDGTARDSYGTACYSPDGTWRIVN
jgi:hypothetical protein